MLQLRAMLVVVAMLASATCEYADSSPAADLVDEAALLQTSGAIQSGPQRQQGQSSTASGGAAKEASGQAETASTVPAFTWKACFAEFIAMTLFVFVGCGSAMSVAKREGSAWILQVSLCFGLMITVLAYSIGHYSGGHINCAVTLALWVSGSISIEQAVGNFVAQILGSIFGALILHLMYREESDCTGGLGCNAVSAEFSRMGALLGEVMGTFILVYVVHEVAVNPLTAANVTMAPLAIGVAVFLAHCILIPVDGCSINPTRTLGPHIVCSLFRKAKPSWGDMWVFWIGPCAGALIASGIYAAMHNSGLGPATPTR